MAPLLPCLVILLATANAQFGNSHLRYNMPEFKDIDTEKFDYESIVEDDIWKYKVHLDAGIKEIDAAFYTTQIYNKRFE